MSPENKKDRDAKPDVDPAARRSDPLLDIFIGHTMFPEPSAVFTSRPATMTEAKDKACIVLDTNALLVPYGISAKTLGEIETTYRRLLQENRLVIPAQVAREFARNRVTKLADLYQQLSSRLSKLQSFKEGSYTLLESLPEYQRLRDKGDELDRLAKEYRELISSVMDHVHSWEWNDPVSLLYGNLFPKEIVVDTVKPLSEISEAHARRYANKIPPGYKDQDKDDQGIGDLLIWLTVLEIGAARRTSLIFVSGEEKADWWHRSDGRQLYPRFELVDEYRRASGGSSFHIIKFSRLLELFDASVEGVAEVREEEVVVARGGPAELGPHLRGVRAEIGVERWFAEGGYEVRRSPDSLYDFLAEGPIGGVLLVDVCFVRHSRDVDSRLVALSKRHRQRKFVGTVVVVIVSERDELLELAKRYWETLDPPFRLVTGLLTPEGQFEVVRPL